MWLLFYAKESLEHDIILQHFYNTLNIILQHVYNVLVLSYGGSKFFSLFYFLIVKILWDFIKLVKELNSESILKNVLGDEKLNWTAEFTREDASCMCPS